MSEPKDLAQKVKELQEELVKRDQDLKIYKNELAQANKELEKLIVQVNDQLRQSARIQKFLVPTEFPNIQGFEFSTKFSSSAAPGGDYFDIFEHYDKMRFGVFLSSASGYGLSSLFLSALMKMTYEIEDTKSKNPHQVVEDILADLKNQSQTQETAALFYGVFDRRKFEMIYCNVGQPLAIHYVSATGQLELLGGAANAFSTDAELVPMENHVVSLGPGDKIILCSAGFLELANSEGETWGIEEILSVVRDHITRDVHGLRNEIFYQAHKFAPVQTRDLTALVIEVKDRIIKLA